MEPKENLAQTIEEVTAEKVVTEAPQTEVTPPVAAGSAGSDVVFTDKPKKNKGAVVAMALLALLAAGGIGFGVWAWLDKNHETETLNSQITDLKQQNESLTNKVAALEDEIDKITSIAENQLFGEAIDGVFYIKNGADKTIAQDDSIEVVELVSCSYDNEDTPSTLTCEVVTIDGQGQYVYNYSDETLTFTAASN